MLEKQDIAILKGMFEVQKKEIDERFTLIDKRFMAIDGRFGKMDERFESIERRLDKMSFSLVQMKADIIADIGDLLESSVFIPLNELRQDNIRIKRHINLA
jgi:hypothetical protein